MTEHASNTQGVYEDVLTTLRLSTLSARQQHHPEKAPSAWLKAFIERMHALGWDTVSQGHTQHLYTPAPGLWKEISEGQLPAPQAPNTRFKTVVRHMIDARSDGSLPLPRASSDRNIATHMLTEVQMPVSGPPLFRLVQLAGSPDPEAPKTRLPLARICWEATFDIQRFDAQRAQVTEEMRRYQHTITDL